MARFRHNGTGVVANFPDDEGRHLSAVEWSLVEPAAPVVIAPPAPTRKRTPKPDAND